MPRHVEDLRNGEPFPVKPDSNEYEALSFLVRNRDYGFTPAEIAERTDVKRASAAKTVARLFEKGLVERADGSYFVDPDNAEEVKRRLDSLDAAVRIHDTAPDDAYAQSGWEDDVSSLDPGGAGTPAETDDETDATDLVARVADDAAGE